MPFLELDIIILLYLIVTLRSFTCSWFDQPLQWTLKVMQNMLRGPVYVVVDGCLVISNVMQHQTRRRSASLVSRSVVFVGLVSVRLQTVTTSALYLICLPIITYLLWLHRLEEKPSFSESSKILVAGPSKWKIVFIWKFKISGF